MISSLLKQETTLLKNVSTHAPQPNYKQLYQECKHNVAVFMKQVDHEITKILNTHAAEKRKLQKEIETLRAQLQQQNHNGINYSRNPSVKSFNPNKSTSQLRDKSYSSLTKQTVEECLAKFTTLQLTSRGSSRRQESFQGVRSKKSRQVQKQNFNIPSNIYSENELDLKALEAISNGARREKRFRSKKNQQSTEKVQNIKDFLKSMRGKLNSESSQCHSAREQNNDPVVTIISPEMFSGRSKRT